MESRTNKSFTSCVTFAFTGAFFRFTRAALATALAMLTHKLGRPALEPVPKVKALANMAADRLATRVKAQRLAARESAARVLFRMMDRKGLGSSAFHVARDARAVCVRIGAKRGPAGYHAMADFAAEEAEEAEITAEAIAMLAEEVAADEPFSQVASGGGGWGHMYEYIYIYTNSFFLLYTYIHTAMCICI